MNRQQLGDILSANAPSKTISRTTQEITDKSKVILISVDENGVLVIEVE